MHSKKFCWPVFLYIAGYHLLLAGALPVYFLHHSPSWGLIGSMLALVFISGTAITAGYHRLYSHSSYKAHPIIEPFLLFFGSLATQGSAIRWSHDHRLHHAFVDQDRDPYTVKEGFWHAHILWLFKATRPIETKVVNDLLRNKQLKFQHEYYVPCMLASNLLVFVIAGFISGDWWGAFLFIWILRMFLLHHTTWCINSLAHYWGTQSYSEEHSAVDNYMISLLTYGEGYHNYHHTFAQDYRNGIRWYHFDPTKWLIWTLHKLGLAYDLKKVSDFKIQRALLHHHRDDLLQRLQQSFHDQQEQFSGKVIEIHDRLIEKLSQLQTLLEKTKEMPKKILLPQIRNAKKEFKEEWKQWKAMLRLIRKRIVA
ncbi:MAG: fatty acid desaturase [Chlamydiia bacterium]|nr:fatty acid desaturase [Chlamydiia bacterium]